MTEVSAEGWQKFIFNLELVWRRVFSFLQEPTEKQTIQSNDVVQYLALLL